MNKTTGNTYMVKHLFDRFVICFRWSWSWLGFWRGWFKELKMILPLAWLCISSLTATVMQILLVIVFPLWRLIIEPLKAGATCTDKQAENVRKILDR